MSETQLFVGIVQKTADLFFDGRVPTERVFFITAILRTFESILPVTAPLSFCGTAEQWERVRANYAMGLAQAADCVAVAQSAKWKN
jgi:hypothetical protein